MKGENSKKWNNLNGAEKVESKNSEIGWFKWMDGWMYGWKDAWMYGWMDGWMDWRTDGWMRELVTGEM